ncbi:MAG: hypothetical protein KGR26_03470 [Cyanobacteria bacterium REEB65]|nr:hypothetical protein [Cyanobacteria bacterium REEB65]
MPMHFGTHRRRSRRPERGAILITLTIIIFVFLAVMTLLASSQFSESNAQNAQFGRIQSNYLAESGLWAAFDATASTNSVLFQNSVETATYSATLQYAKPPCWVYATGSMTYAGTTYLSTASAYDSGGVLSWWALP